MLLHDNVAKDARPSGPTDEADFGARGWLSFESNVQKYLQTITAPKISFVEHVSNRLKH